ncbi:hypothetical protein HHL17_27675 [Chitinophaga sp. G-6-1-13]|uniref:Uncharacterized protein n=1 Tax=Chitinophaga fulva TaxID=2728842 RepID=A0A848GQV8_9BACT|nr:hypothetical protein [Chitinophaga fulva]NML41005.1 hypothetical protein [Chitinophaga fulva]
MESCAGAGSPFSFSASAEEKQISAKFSAKHTPPKLTDLRQKIRMRMSKKLTQTETLPYTYPELYRGPKEWYVHFHYRNPETGEMERFKDSWGLNKKRTSTGVNKLQPI